MRRVIAELQNDRKPRIPIIFRWFGLLYFWLAGWRLKGHIPDDPAMVVIAGPHSSNWDGWNVIMTSWVTRVRLRWMVKAEYTRGILGLFVRLTGGLGIDRSQRHNVVSQAADMLRQADDLLLLVAPEGTRLKTDHWKTGFYWIAHEAGAPMIGARMDYGRKVIDFVGPFYTTGDIEADIQPIWQAYAEVSALHPERVSDKALRSKDLQPRSLEPMDSSTSS